MANQHPHDDELERYAMDKLGGDQAAALEEHFLACPECRDRLVEVEDFIATFRSVVAPEASRVRMPCRMSERRRPSFWAVLPVTRNKATHSKPWS